RGGAGVFYGMNVATSFQYAGPAFAKTANMFFTKDNFAHQFACLGPSPTQPNCPNSSPFPGGLAPPQGTTYGDLAMWGIGNSSDLDTVTARNAEIYQWNLGIQHMFPGQVVVVVDSRYIDDTIPQQLLLEPYPQFDGGFEGLPALNANSWYHSLQIRFQKRASHYISFEGNYTFSKSTDDSSAGRNAWLGNLQFDNPQVLDNLKAEHSISANDTPHRLTAAIIFDLPVGKDRPIGGAMNP